MSSALVFIKNETTKEAVWVSEDNPLPVTGGGGGGGAVTIADGADVTQGAVADAAYTTGSGTVVSILKGLFGKIASGAGTAAGAQRVTYASDGATVPVGGNVASGSADSGNPAKVGGVYNSTLPTFTAGQRGDAQISVRGSLRALGTVLNISASDGLANSGFGTLQDEGASNNASRPTLVGPIWYNGSTWDRARGDASNGLVVQSSASEYETVAASQTDQVLGATGAVGDLFDSILIIPGTTSPGAVSIKDGNGSSITIFTGGASSVSNLVPFSVPLGLKAVNATTPGWKVTTGANVTAIGIGNFT